MSAARLLDRVRSADPVAVRFAVFYAALYVGFGAYLPYMPVWYEARGLSPELIGLAGAAAMAGRVVIAPLGAIWSDRAARRRDAIQAFTLAALAIYVLHVPASSPWAIIVLAFLAGASMHAITPLVDAFAMGQARKRGFEFGRPRAVGSAAFILGNLAGGALIGNYGGEAALAWVLAGAACAAVAGVILPPGRRVSEPEPEAPAEAEVKPSRFAVLAPLAAAGLPLAFMASALIQSAHGFYYAFSAIAWRNDGVPSSVVGLLWSTGVACEIVFLAGAGRLLRGWSPAGLMMLGGAASVLRWGAYALSPPVWLLFPLQALHALTFAATYLGFLRYVHDAAPERLTATAQGINSALSGGVFLALASFVSGLAYAAFGAAGFAVMAIPAGLGLACAIALILRRGVA